MFAELKELVAAAEREAEEMTRAAATLAEQEAAVSAKVLELDAARDAHDKERTETIAAIELAHTKLGEILAGVKAA